MRDTPPFCARWSACRVAGFWRLLALSVSYHRGRPRGDLLSRFNSDLDAVELAVSTELPFAVSCLLAIMVGVALLLTVEWRLALVLCALLPMVILQQRTDRSGGS